MKNNHGWGLSTMILFCAVLALCLLFSIITYKTNIEGNISKDNESAEETYEKTYIGLEEDIALSAKEYFKENESDEKIVTLKELIKKENINQIYDLKNSITQCSGYVIRSIDSNLKETFDSYLKCGKNYETAGYLENLDEK